MNPQLTTRLRHLRLSGMVEALPGRVAQAEAAPLPHLEFLELLVEDELARRADRLFARRRISPRITRGFTTPTITPNAPSASTTGMASSGRRNRSSRINPPLPHRALPPVRGAARSAQRANSLGEARQARGEKSRWAVQPASRRGSRSPRTIDDKACPSAA